jgi:ABC-type multidrug transport system fused ATPase/permease subunit
MKLGGKYYQEKVKVRGAVNSNIEESYTGITITELFSLKQQRINKFNKDNIDYTKISKKSMMYGSLYMPVFGMVANLGNTIVCLACALLAFHSATPTI